MARFFKAPLVQPMDYGFQMPFAEVMHVLSTKQKDQDDAVTKLQALQDKATNALSPDMVGRDMLAKDRYGRIESIMYDENGNLQDLTGKGSEIYKEARRQLEEERSGGAHWAYTGSVANRDKYQENVTKNDKIKDFQKDYYLEKSDYDYAKQGGAGRGTLQGSGPNGQFSEKDLYTGIVPAEYVNITEIGEKLGDKVGQYQIQTSGVKLDPNTAQVETVNGTNFIDEASGRLIQTGTLLGTTYDKIFHSVSTGLIADEAAKSYLADEARALAWKKGVKDPPQEMIDGYVDAKIQEESDRAAKKFMEAKFSPSVYQDWKAREDYAHRNAKLLADYEDMKKVDAIEAQLPTQQNIVDPTKLTEQKTLATENLKNINAEIALYSNPDGSIKDKYKNDQNAVESLKAAKAQARKYNIELQGINETEKLVLGEFGLNSGTIVSSIVNEDARKYDSTGRISNILGSYLLTGNPDPSKLTTDQKSELDKLVALQELYAKDPKKAGAAMTPDQLARAEEIASGNWNKALDSKVRSIPFTYAGMSQASGDQHDLFKALIKTGYTDKRSSLLSESANKLNESGGLNYQSNNILIEAAGTTSTSSMAMLQETATNALRKTNFAGLVVSEGGLSGRDFDPSLFTIGDSNLVIQDPQKDIEFRLVKDNVGKPGMGGEGQYALVANVYNKSTKTYSTRSLTVMKSPTASSGVPEYTKEASIEMINATLEKVSKEGSQTDWALGTQLLGGSHSTIKALFDQGVVNQPQGTNKIYRDEEGRELVGVRRLTGGQGYEIYSAKPGQQEKDIFNPSNLIRDGRANFKNTQKPIWKNISDFQQQLGEELYLRELNQNKDFIRRKWGTQ